MGIYFHVDVALLVVHVLLRRSVVHRAGGQGSDVHLLLRRFVANLDA